MADVLYRRAKSGRIWHLCQQRDRFTEPSNVSLCGLMPARWAGRGFAARPASGRVCKRCEVRRG